MQICSLFHGVWHLGQWVEGWYLQRRAEQRYRDTQRRKGSQSQKEMCLPLPNRSLKTGQSGALASPPGHLALKTTSWPTAL